MVIPKLLSSDAEILENPPYLLYDSELLLVFVQYYIGFLCVRSRCYATTPVQLFLILHADWRQAVRKLLFSVNSRLCFVVCCKIKNSAVLCVVVLRPLCIHALCYCDTFWRVSCRRIRLLQFVATLFCIWSKYLMYTCRQMTYCEGY